MVDHRSLPGTLPMRVVSVNQTLTINENDGAFIELCGLERVPGNNCHYFTGILRHVPNTLGPL